MNEIQNLVKKYSADTTEVKYEEAIYILYEYIKEKKGKEIKINPPRSMIEQSIFNSMFNVAFNYFCSKDF